MVGYFKVILSTSIVSVGAILGIGFQYDLFFIYWWTSCVLTVFVPLTLLTGFAALNMVLAKRRVGKILGYGLVVSGSCVVSLVVFEMTGSWIDRWKVEAVVSYVAHAVPVLDQVKQKEGSYPAKLPIDLLGEPPELLRYYGSYASAGSTFRFEYENEPAGWAGGGGSIVFDSEVRTWIDGQ